jgi:hypothetical protein
VRFVEETRALAANDPSVKARQEVLQAVNVGVNKLVVLLHLLC